MHLIFNIVVVFTLIVLFICWESFMDAKLCKKKTEKGCDATIVRDIRLHQNLKDQFN